MDIYEDFQSFWNEFAVVAPNKHGFADWQVVSLSHTSDVDYRAQRAKGVDELGFQPLSVVLADGLKHESRRLVIKNVNDAMAQGFAAHCRQQYLAELPSRFDSFKPDQFTAYTEYDDWQSFYTTWLERDGKPVFDINVPLIIDHTPKLEQWTRKQTGQKHLPYQRLLVTTYFTTQDKFFDFFIKNIDDAAANQIKLLMQSRIGLNSEELFKLGAA